MRIHDEKHWDLLSNIVHNSVHCDFKNGWESVLWSAFGENLFSITFSPKCIFPNVKPLH